MEAGVEQRSVYSIYYSRYSTLTLVERGRGEIVLVVIVVREQEMLLFRCYDTTGIYNFG